MGFILGSHTMRVLRYMIGTRASREWREWSDAPFGKQDGIDKGGNAGERACLSTRKPERGKRVERVE